MKVCSEISLSEFHFWSGAKDFASELTEKQFNVIEFILENLFPDGLSETEINDLFWFEQETIREWADMPCEEIDNIPEEAKEILGEYYDLDSFNGSTDAFEEYESREVYYIPESYREKYTSIKECYESALDEDELFDDNENGDRIALIWFGSIDDGYFQ